LNNELIRQLISKWGSHLCTASYENVAVSIAPVNDYTSVLYENEKELINKAVHKRRVEFSTGRMLARMCIAMLKTEVTEVLQGENREPIWQKGLKGSISHNDILCAAVVTDNENILSVGIDIELTDGVTPDLWEHIFSLKEREYIKDSPAPLETAAILFSAKEAFYKMQFPITRQVIEFKDAEITLRENTFVVSSKITDNPFFNDIYTGDYFVTDKHVFTIISLEKVTCG